ncbi:MAG: cytochrome P450 [Filomicrobium sp.]
MRSADHPASAEVNGEPVSLTRAGPPLYPPRIQPPEEPLALPAFLREFTKNPIRVLPRAVYEGDILALRPSVPRVVYCWITSPELIEDVLIKRASDLNKSPVEKRVFAKSVGDSVLTADMDHWKWQRRVLAPLFRHQQVLDYVPQMSAAARWQVEVWQKAGPSVRDVEDDMTEATLGVIMSTMLGSTDMDTGHRIMEATEHYLSVSSWEAACAILKLPEWFPHPGSWSMRSSARELRGIMADMIQARRESGGDDTDLLGRLLAAVDPETGRPMDEEGLVNNLSTLLLAGHETTAKALTWTLYLLARAPHWQDAVREEVMKVTGGDPIAAQHIDELEVTTRVLKEAMRLYPPVPVIARVNTQPIEAGGEHLPVGSNIVFPVYAIHRHNKSWRDPDRFDPDRFTEEKAAQISRTQYMPFGAGPRLCIGQSFAMMEAVTLLATFIRAMRFEWDAKHEPEPVSRVTLRPKGGMPLMVQPLK